MKKFGWVSILVLTLMVLSFVGCGDSVGTTHPELSMRETPLTLEAIVSGTTIILTNPGNMHNLKYTKNGGDFVNVTASENSITLAAGDKIALYADGSENTFNIYTQRTTAFSINCYSECYVYGNVMSLLKSANFKNVTSISTKYALASLFYENRSIKNHPEKMLVLPATTLADACYSEMFAGCTSLTSAPELPATTLATGCYYGMFERCTRLTRVPELPATTLANACYTGMFDRCTGLTSTPELPATTLADGCYHSMFSNCTGLTNPPELPATTLTDSCYAFMFMNCTSLTSAPELPATTLTNYCYEAMFEGCERLSSVTCLATDISATSCTENWLQGVASSGTFKKTASMTSWTTGSASGIPSGWTAQNYSAPTNP